MKVKKESRLNIIRLIGIGALAEFNQMMQQSLIAWLQQEPLDKEGVEHTQQNNDDPGGAGWWIAISPQ